MEVVYKVLENSEALTVHWDLWNAAVQEGPKGE